MIQTRVTANRDHILKEQRVVSNPDHTDSNIFYKSLVVLAVLPSALRAGTNCKPQKTHVNVGYMFNVTKKNECVSMSVVGYIPTC